MREPEVRAFKVKDIFAVVEPRLTPNVAGLEFVIVSRHYTYEEAVEDATKQTKANKNYTYIARLLSIVAM